MSDKNQSRRDFLKLSAAGAAGITLAANVPPVFASNAGAWTDGKQINPHVDNLRVVRCCDTTMITNHSFSDFGNFTNVNNAVSTAKVMSNMDEMAKRLASTTDANAAWAKIFQQPAKGYAASKVAIKLNTRQGNNTPRAAVVGKICQVLVGLGVLPANIIVYDGNTGGVSARYTPYMGAGLPIPAGVTYGEGGDIGSCTALGGSTSNIAVPGTTATSSCLTNIANGTIDILVNIAVNKGWNGGTNWASVTLTMKNHYGTWNPDHGTTGYIYGINKSNAIIGGTPPRQQLCIVDSLWAMINGPDGSPADWSHPEVDTLMMGTFSPAVDYLTVRKVREVAPMSVAVNTDIPTYLTSFGYTSTQYTNLDVVDYQAAVGVEAGMAGAEHQPFDLHVISDRAGHERVTLHVPSDAPALVNVYTVEGNLVRSLSSSERSIVWDATDANGAHVSAGTYVLKVSAGQITKSASVVIR